MLRKLVCKYLNQHSVNYAKTYCISDLSKLHLPYYKCSICGFYFAAHLNAHSKICDSTLFSKTCTCGYDSVIDKTRKLVINPHVKKI